MCLSVERVSKLLPRSSDQSWLLNTTLHLGEARSVKEMADSRQIRENIK